MAQLDYWPIPGIVIDDYVQDYPSLDVEQLRCSMNG